MNIVIDEGGTSTSPNASASASANTIAYAYTGGKPFDPALPTVVLIHGAQHDHSVWALQSRYLAHHGFNVLAVDLPGHHRSTGSPLSTIEAMADWLHRLLDTLAIERALFAGHSMGSLIALEAAAQRPSRCSALALFATAFPMRVSDALLNAAAHREPEAIEMVNQWSHSTFAAKPSCPAPGFWLHGINQQLMQRISDSNEAPVFSIDFTACNTYDAGLRAAASIRCPTRLVVGRRDLMTPPSRLQPLIEALASSGAPVDTVTLDCGHAMLAEQPDACLDALHEFAQLVSRDAQEQNGCTAELRGPGQTNV
jgi:pimeloyl-ACP methyl ester carboxylesterase